MAAGPVKTREFEDDARRTRAVRRRHRTRGHAARGKEGRRERGVGGTVRRPLARAKRRGVYSGSAPVLTWSAVAAHPMKRARSDNWPAGPVVGGSLFRVMCWFGLGVLLQGDRRDSN
jgi:hypothetical protein